MKISYSPEVDIAYIKLGKGKYKISEQKAGGDVVVDFSVEGKVIGLEIFYASKVVPELVKNFDGSRKRKEINFAAN